MSGFIEATILRGTHDEPGHVRVLIGEATMQAWCPLLFVKDNSKCYLQVTNGALIVVSAMQAIKCVHPPKGFDYTETLDAE